jgi:hypothetical protein
MNKQAAAVRAVFRGIAKMSKSYTLEIGPLRATGVPAILAAVTGIVLASGIASALSRNAERLPETLREARGLAETIRPRQTPLNP